MGRVIRFATWPARFALSIALDVAFGKADSEPYVSRTSCRAPHCWSEYGTACGSCPRSH